MPGSLVGSVSYRRRILHVVHHAVNVSGVVNHLPSGRFSWTLVLRRRRRRRGEKDYQDLLELLFATKNFSKRND